MNSPWGPCPAPSEIGSRHEKVTFLTGMGFGLTVGLGLGELTATAEAEAGGEGAPAWGTVGAAQAQMNPISAMPAHLISVERALPWQRYCAP